MTYLEQEAKRNGSTEFEIICGIGKPGTPS